MNAGGPGSPLVSSPGDSRAGSPRARRRASRDRSPPPMPPDQHLPHLTANFDNLAVGEVCKLDPLLNHCVVCTLFSEECVEVMTSN